MHNIDTLPQPATDDGPALILALLDAQRASTAVERFALAHESDALPAQSRLWRDMIPEVSPGAGQQYAFEVDLDACSGCKACVTACHSLNGLDEGETWRSVGLLVGGTVSLPIVQHVTSACHHCLEPACMDGCPVLAYEKDPITGIVRHLDDQCIGCQYCVLKCPYDVPKYNSKKGIVRKCDMCSGRLAAGEAPACVQGCPNQAIRIRIVEARQIIRESQGDSFVPGAAHPDYTLPTTQYKTARALPRNVLPADFDRVTPEHAHWPLVIMLVLTQLSAGGFAVEQCLDWFTHARSLGGLRTLHAFVSLTLGLTALSASVLHLGRPLYAFRAFLGLRRSWLSREILAFGLFAALASVYAAACWMMPARSGTRLLQSLGLTVALAGLLGVFCSAMIYHDTRRPFWRFEYTGTKFLLTTLLLGSATMLLTAVLAAAWGKRPELDQMVAGWGHLVLGGLIGLSALKIALGLAPLLHIRDRQQTPLKRTARLAIGPLLQPTLSRFALALLGGVVLPAIALNAFSSPGVRAGDVAVLVVASWLMMLGAELLERYLFFAAAVAPRMPGGVGQ